MERKKANTNNQTSFCCGTTSSDLIYIQFKYPKSCGIPEELIAKIFPNLMKGKTRDARISTNSK